MAEYHIRWDPTNKKWESSVDGAAFSDLVENPKVEKIRGSAGINIDATTVILQDPAGGSYLPQLILRNTNADNSISYIIQDKLSASLASGDPVGGYIYRGYDSNLTIRNFVLLQAYTRVVTAGADRGQFQVIVYNKGTGILALDVYDDFVSVPVRFDTPTLTVRAYNNANITVNTGVITLITLNSENYDTNAFHDLTTSNSRLTVPAGCDGYYRVTGRVRFDITATLTYRDLRLEKNSAGTSTVANIFAINRAHTSNNVVTDVEVAGTVYLAVGDYVELFAGTGENTTALYLNILYDSPSLEMFRVGK